MSSALVSALTSLQQNDYVTFIILTAVGYDYILTFSKEIEYIWSKPWTSVSTLFIFVRYIGLCNFVTASLVGTTLLPGPAKLYFQGEAFFTITGWTYYLFFDAANIVMILRVWVLYNRSRLLLGSLLVLYALQFISDLPLLGIYSLPKKQMATTVQTLDYSICVEGGTSVSPPWTKVPAVSQVAFAATMCTLAIIQFVKQSLQMYRARQWQINRYMSLLVQQGTLYFFAVFLHNLLYILGILGYLPTQGWTLIVTYILEYVPLYTLTPRFIMHIRELYARDARGICGEEIDTGFGLSSSTRSTASVGGTGMVFADVGRDEGSEDGEEMAMETRTGLPE